MYKGSFYVRFGKRIFIVEWEIDATPTGTITVIPHWAPGDTLWDVLSDDDVESITHAVFRHLKEQLGSGCEWCFHFLANEAIDAGSSVG